MTLQILWFDETDLSTLGAGQITKTLTLLNGLSEYVDITLLCRCSSPQILQKNLRKVKVISLKPGIRNPLLRLFPHDVTVYAMHYIRKSFDLVIFSHIYESLPLLLSFKLRGLPIIYDCHGVELMLLEKSLTSKLTIVSMESLSVKLSDTVIVLSDADKEDLKRLYSINDDDVVVIPPWRINNPCSEVEREEAKERLAKAFGNDIVNKTIVTFHGSLKYGPNRDAWNHIVNYIAPEVRQAIFVVVGKDPPFKGRKANIIFTGPVTNLREVLCCSDVAIVPLTRVTGVNFKVLDYVSLGIPLIVSPAVLRWLNLDDVEGTVIVSKVKDVPWHLKELVGKGLERTRWKKERSVEDVIQDYLKVLIETRDR